MGEDSSASKVVQTRSSIEHGCNDDATWKLDENIRVEGEYVYACARVVEGCALATLRRTCRCVCKLK